MNHKPRKGARQLVIKEQDYWWRVGRSNVEIWDPNNKKTVVDFSTLTGKSWYSIERGQHKRYFSITPKEVTDYINKNGL